MFIVYPTVFNVIGSWANILGLLFFITVYLAGLTSILSTIEPLSFSIQNKFGLTRKKTMTILIIVAAAFSMLYATGFGEALRGYADNFINQIAILLGVILECIIFAWVFKAEKLIDFMNSRSRSIKVGKWWLVIVKFVLPVVLLIIWVGGLVDVVYQASFDQVIFTVLLAIVLLGATILLTRLPAKSPDWDDSTERV